MPSSYTKDQQEAEYAKFQALLSTISQLKQKCLSPHLPHSQVLEYYVPLKGGTTADSDPAYQFEAYNRIHSFLSPNNRAAVAVLFGTAGAGKSLFARFVEKSLWKSWDPNNQQQQIYGNSDEIEETTVIPIYISLPQHFSLVQQLDNKTKVDEHSRLQLELIETTFENLNFSVSDVSILKTKARFLFILDGLDEVPLDLLPTNNFLQHTNVVKWLGDNDNNSTHKVVITCRTQQVPIIETKIGKHIQEYFHLPTTIVPSNTLVESFHLMPFNTSQIKLFLQGYSQSPEAKLNSSANWTVQQYQHSIENIGSLMSLVQNPFTLRLVAGILPQLVQRQKHINSITTSDVYGEFTKQMFERETWKRLSQSQVPLTLNLIDQFQHLSESIALTLFERASTLLPLQDITSSTSTHLDNSELLVSIPVHISNGEIRFIHKSLQEFFIAQAWFNHFNTTSTNDKGDQDRSVSSLTMQLTHLLSTNLVSREAGVLNFLSQLIQHHRHASVLLHQILKSRHDKSLQQQVASSNAMSILNAARFSFSGMDLSNTSIPNANMQYVVMEQTDLSHCNLSGCALFGAWMKRANLRNSVMANVELAELPWIDCDSGCLSISHNEKSGFFVTGLENGNVTIWDMQSMKQIGDPLLGHTNWVTSVEVQNGKIVSGSYDKTIRVWDMETMKQIGDPLRGHTDKVTSIAVYKGKIISGSFDHTIIVWDMETMKQIGNPLRGHAHWVRSVAVYNGKIVSASNDKTIRIWDIETMKQIGEPLQGHTDWVMSIAVHDGKIISGSNDKTIRVWDIETMKLIGDPLQGHTRGVISVAVHNGKLVSGSEDSTIMMWDIETMKQINDPLQGHTNYVWSVAVHNNKIVSGSADKTIKVWDIETMKQIGDPLQGHTGWVASVQVHNGRIVSGSDEKTIRVWDIETMKQIGDPLLGHTDRVTSIAVYKGKIVSGSYDTTIRVWDMETMKQIGDPLLGHTDRVMSVAVYNNKIVSGSADKTIRVWDMETMKQIGDPLQSHDKVMSIAVHDGKIASGSFDKTIRVWDMKTMKQIGDPLLGHTGWVTSVGILNGKIISGSADKTIRIWDMEKMRQIGDPLQGHAHWVRSVAVHNGVIVSGSDDKTIRMWDMETMKQIGAPLQGHTERVMSVTVYNGKIVSSSSDKTIRIWNMGTICESSSQGGYMIQSTSRLPLCFEECNIEGVIGLSDLNKRAIK